MALTFDANYYLSARPDVFNAFVATAGKTGQTWAQFAEAHYNTYGRFEGSNPNTTFNTKEYLTANPDVAAAGINPFTHFLNYGAKEGRAPSASFPSYASFDEKTYLAANTDLATAGITTKAQAYEHFVKYGQFESRPGAPTIDTSVPGTTYTLTTGVDPITGTSNNDTINAYIGAGTTSTLNGADVINGGAGIDTLAITTDNTGGLSAALISNVEVFKIRDIGAGATYDFATVTGETSVINNKSTSGVTFDNIAAGASVTILGDGSTTNGATTFKMAAATDAVTLNLDSGVTAGAITRNASGAATVVINSTGAANKVGAIDLDSGALMKSVTINAKSALTGTLVAADYAAGSTLTVTGAAKVDLSGAALSANFTKVDASAMTAGGLLVAVDQTDATVDTQFIGGKGDDTLDIGKVVYSSTTLTAAGGDGTDTLKVSDQAAITSTTAKYISGFETLSLYDDNDATLDTFDVSLLSGITSIKIAADSAGDGYALTNLTAAQAAAITISGSQAVGPTFGIKDASVVGNLDTLALTIDDGATAAATITLANITAAGVETVTLANAETLTLSSATGLGALTKLAVTGAGNTSITTGALALNVNTVIDASASTGTFTIDASAATTNGLAIKGSATGANTITGTAQNDTITGGTGIDTVKHGGGTDTVDFISDSKADILEFAVVGGKVTVTNFDAATTTTTEDLVNVSDDAFDGAEVAVTAAASKAAIATDTTYVFEVTAGAAAAITTGGTATITDFTNTTQVAAYLDERFSVTNAGTEKALVFVNNGTNTYAYAVQNDGGANTTVSAAEVTLVGVFNAAVLNNGDIYQTV